nr:tRNA methyl transferase PRC-barrel domain-containing protein [Mobiluncus mulieris]
MLAWQARRAQPGAIVDENGAVVGQHLGAFLYTVGQRRLHLPRPTKMASHAMLPGWM